MKQFEMCVGSWNVPLIIMDKYSETDAYKIFRSPLPPLIPRNSHPFIFEFHNAWVPVNTWLKAELSQSSGMSGLTEPS